MRHDIDRRSQQLLVASHEAKRVAGVKQTILHWQRALADAEAKYAEALVGATDEKPERLERSVRLFQSRIADAQADLAEAEKAFREVQLDVCERCGLKRDEVGAVSVVRDASGVPVAIEA